MKKREKQLFISLVCMACFLLLVATACEPVEDNAPPISPADDSSTAYPGTLPFNPSPEPEFPYPGPEPTLEGLQAVPPNPEVNLPETQSAVGVVGGVLIREIADQGFVPLVPKSLALGEIVTTDSGEPAYVRTSGDSPQAELFPTGIFIFRNVSPGTYGLVVDLGFTQFLVESSSGEAHTFSVEAGQVLNIGQVITKTPD
jgi:hypothetical protein